MKTRFRLYPRRNGIYYCEDVETRSQVSLGTKDRHEAERLFHARNEAYLLPAMNLQMARTYLTACDPAIATKTWQDVMETIVKDKTGSTRVRWNTAIKDKAFDTICDVRILETIADHFLEVLSNGIPGTNACLRRLHNFALGMSWLAWPLIARKLWPKQKPRLPEHGILLQSDEKSFLTLSEMPRCRSDRI